MNSADPNARLTEGLGYLVDDRYLLHDPGSRHPESPQRLVTIQKALRDSGIPARWQPIWPRPATIDELGLIHHPVHIQRVQHAVRHAPAYLDVDTSVSAESYMAALLAAGGVLECMDALCTGRLRRIFAFVRPPGHHANAESARGFCLFNNVALAAAYVRTKHKIARVAIVDFDVHHGDGTQDIFWHDPNVLFISFHQDGRTLYPGSGFTNEMGGPQALASQHEATSGDFGNGDGIHEEK